MLPGPVEARPRYRGLPVPYLVPVDDERLHGDDQLRFAVDHDGGLSHVAFVDEQPGDRDADGVLWIRVTPTSGSSTAEMGKVHARRQRECMLTPACQVCSAPLPAGAVPWVLPLTEMTRLRPDGTLRTPTPPTCLDCAEVSRRLCPLLRRDGSRLYLVRAHRPWGVIGAERGGAASVAALLGTARPQWIPYADTARTGRTIAEQMILELASLEHVDDVPPN
jgi:hypothetical protein